MSNNVKSTIICGTSISAMMLAMMAPTAAFAQEADAVDEIVVTGIRASLKRSQAVKRANTSIVEALSAEDIGKLPDSSIAESLARLPGLAGERKNGRTSGLSVRGFKEDFVGTSLNGRELLGIGDNRGVEYDLYPSEIMTGAVIYKSPDATLSVVGVGGTVDLKTVRPLEASEVKRINASYETNSQDSDNPDFDASGHRLSGTIIEHLANDTIGVALTVATTDSPLSRQENTINSFQARGPDGVLWPASGNWRAVSEVLKRDTVSGIVQFQPNDKLDIVVDGLYIDFSNEGVSRGFWGGLPFGSADVLESGNLVRSGTSLPFHSTYITNALLNSGDLTTFGVNATYDFDNQWSVALDAAHSEADKSVGRVESYAGVGRSGTTTLAQATTREWELTDRGLFYTGGVNTDFSDFGLVRLAGPQAWGGGLGPIQSVADLAATYTGPGVLTNRNAQDGFINEAIIGEELDTLSLALSRGFDDGFVRGVEFGGRYSKRTKEKVNSGHYLTANTFPYDEVIPEQYRVGLTDLSWVGLGQTVAYDVNALLADGYYTLHDARVLQTARVGDSFVIDEELLTGFAKVDFETEQDGFVLTGNVGVQVVNVDQSSNGASGIVGPDGFVQEVTQTGGASYTDILPSLNVNLDFGGGHTIRGAAAKVVSRPRFDSMRPGGSVSFHFNIDSVAQTNPADGPWSASAGNPALRPLEANQFDVAYDWYFADDGYLSVGYFYKDLVNWHRNGVSLTDFTEFYIPAFHNVVNTTTNEVVQPGTLQGLTTFKEDGLEGKVDGIELSASLPLRLVSKHLDGFGLIGSAAFNSGSLDDGARVPGLSDDVYQAAAFYENKGLSARVSMSKRSDFESERRNGSNLVTLNKQAIELWDAQVGYDFGESGVKYLEGLSVTLKALNLTSEDDVSVEADDARLVRQHLNYGTTYAVELGYTF